ncbi:ribokinase [Salipaludibacillus daqingensis]|uniref:ribokinase n=1 Tax=Salipaludibacillus daqingensis TaxID=3041001 RepID=UPI002473A6F7|nr:ribokinase [Salipaludibacillus daqingensis]
MSEAVKKQKKILVIGSYNLDMISTMAYLPKPGETVLGNGFFTSPGGKGANQVIAASYFLKENTFIDAEIYFIGKVGKDSFGDDVVRHFSSLGIQIDYLKRDDSVGTGTAQILVDDAGENSIVVSPGANYFLTPDNIRSSKQVIQEADLILVQFEIPMETIEEVIQLVSESKATLVVNPAPAFAIRQDLMPIIDYLTPNITELSNLTGYEALDNHTLIEEAARSLLAKGVSNIVVTMGAEGVMHVHDHGAVHYPSYNVHPVDTSGAGDCFNGVFAAAILCGYSINQAINSASASAALSVTKRGTSSSFPHPEDVTIFMKEKMI